ncbi:MAG: hypothetical protein F2813_01665, partial [Actinobacteria bacterium]|nr:hypothetical protein [Actinomycetota bacterium]
DSSGETVSTLPNGEPTTFSARIRFTEAVNNPIFSVSLANGARVPLFTASSDWSGKPSGKFEAGEEVVWRIEFDNPLGPDRYTVTPSVTIRDGATLAARERMSSVVVTRIAAGPLVDIPFSEELRR